jgi:hypothetical protein
MPLKSRPANYILTTSKLNDLAKLVKNSFVKDGISIVCFDDFYRLIMKVFPFHVHKEKSEKEIIKQLEVLVLVFNPQKMTVDVNKQKKRKFYVVWHGVQKNYRCYKLKLSTLFSQSCPMNQHFM